MVNMFWICCNWIEDIRLKFILHIYNNLELSKYVLMEGRIDLIE